MIWHLNELELLVAFRENAPSSAAAVGAAVKAVEIADCDVATAGGQADSAMGRGKGAESGRVSMVILRDSVQFMPARGSDTQLLIALTLRSSANPSGAVPCHGPSCYCCAER